VAYSPDGGQIASSRSEGTNDVEQIKQGKIYRGEINIWDSRTGKPLVRFGHDAALTDLAFSPDAKRLVGASADCAIGKLRRYQAWLPSPPGAGEWRIVPTLGALRSRIGVSDRRRLRWHLERAS
jgi:hypothetical protein